MAKKKINKKKKKQNNAFQKIIAIIILIAICVFLGYNGFLSIQEINVYNEEIEKFTLTIPEEASTNILLPEKINDEIYLEWVSSNEKVIDKSGVVTPPAFDEADETVSLKANLVIDYKHFLSKTIHDFLNKSSGKFEYLVKVKAKIASDEDKVQYVLDRLYVPSTIYEDIELPTSLCFEGVSLEWSSSNSEVVNGDGIVNTPASDTLVTLSVKVKSNTFEVIENYDVEVLASSKVLKYANDHFDDQAKTNTYKDLVSTNNITYHQARIIQNNEALDVDETDLNAPIPSFVRLRTKEESIGGFETSEITNPYELKFKYKFSGTQKSEETKLVITLIGNETKSVEEIVLHKNDFIEYSLNIQEYQKVKIKVEHISPFKETFIDIDEVIITYTPSIDDLESYVKKNVSTEISKAVVLPFTTPYGGRVTWTSSSPNITNTGIVTREDEIITATLNCNIKFLGEEVNFTIEVNIKGKIVKDSLEIYFIDIGKYGAGDCGESIYIKYNDVDIIVDAGDNFDSTKNAINEVITTHLEDGVIEYVIATHPDGDHIGGMSSLFESFNIKNLIKFEGGYHTGKYEKMKSAWEEEKCNVYQIKSDIIDKNLEDRFIKISQEISISFIDTTYYDSTESNGKSIVFVLDAYSTRVLLTGDADNATGHTDLEAKYQNKVGDIDILKVVHHGTNNGSTESFIKAVDPEVAIICNGNYLGNKHGHPSPTAINNLYNYDSEMKVYAICGGGTIDGVANMTNKTYKCSSEDRFNQRNGVITILIDNNSYVIKSEYTEIPIEMKDTIYYQSFKQSGL